jgi:hypothetical protein
MTGIKEKIKSKGKGLVLNLKSFFSQEYFKNVIVAWLLILSLAANLADWAVLKFLIQPMSTPIILHYNVYFGVDWKGSYPQVFSIPLIGLFLFLVNGLLALKVYREGEIIASYLLLMAVLMLQISLIVYSLSIILINY